MLLGEEKSLYKKDTNLPLFPIELSNYLNFHTK